MAELTEQEVNLAQEYAQFPLHAVNNADFAIVPAGYALHDLEKYHNAPRRMQAKVTLLTADSFFEYVHRFKTPRSRIYAQPNPAQLVAVLDDHYDALGSAGFRQHVATYKLEHSREWKTWLGKNNKPESQDNFAQFMEDNLSDVFQPEPSWPDQASMRDVSRNLQAKTNVEFDSRVRLDNGERVFSYSETVSGTARQGQLIVPERFGISIPVFQGGLKKFIAARLRYRVQKEGLSMWYSLIDAEKLVDLIFAEIVADVAVKTETMTVFGAPGL